MKTERTMADGLRALADFLDANPELQAAACGQTVHIFAKDKAHLAQMLKGIGGIEKNFARDWFYATKHFGGRVEVQICLEREKACRKVITGTKTVTVPAKPAEPERTVEVEESKWVCDPILAPVEKPAEPPHIVMIAGGEPPI